MTLNPQDSALERMEQEDQSSDDAAVDAGASLYDSFISPMPKPGTYVPQTGLAAARTLGNAAMSQRQKNESVHRSRALRLWRELHGGESVSGWLAQKLQPYWPQPGRFCRTGRAAAR